MSRRRKVVTGTVGIALAAFVLLLALFDWSWLRSPLESLASNALGREVAIAGDIDGEISLTPRFSFEGVSISNAPWGSRPHMLAVKKLAVEVDLMELVRGRVAVPEIAVRAPDVLVERDEAGMLNWQLGGGGSNGGGPPPAIGNLWAQDASITYREPQAEREIRTHLATLRGTGGLRGDRIALRGVGTLADLPLRLDLKAGTLDELQDSASPYPVDIALRAGATSLSVQGSISEPMNLAAAQLDVRLDSPDPAPLLALAAPVDESLPSLALSGQVVHERQAWRVRNLEAKLGESTLSGEAGIDLGAKPLLISADLTSEHLDVDGLQSLSERLSPAPSREPAAPAPPVWSPEEGLNRALLPDLQLDVALDARDVVARAGDLHLGELSIDGELRDRVPRLQLSARGRYRGEPVVIEASAGSEAPAAEPYRLDARLEVGANTVRVSGSMEEPLSLAGLDATFDLEAPQVQTVLGMLGLPRPQVPDLMLSGKVSRTAERWQLDDFAARLGQSDIGGRVTLDTSTGGPSLRADLRSERIRIADLQRLAGPRTERAAEEVAQEAAEELPVPEPAAGPERPLITMDGIDRSALPDWQAELDYTLARLVGPQIELENVELRSRLQDQVVAASLSAAGQIGGEPLDLSLRLGTPDGEPSAEGAYPIEAHLEAGRTVIDINGELARAMRFGEGRVSFEMVSPTPGSWEALAGLPQAEIPQVRAAGELVRDGERWRLADLYLELGESNLFGTASADLSRGRPLLTADLQSNRVLFSDLMAMQRITPEEAEEEMEEEAAPGPPPPVSARGINLEGLPEVDAELALDLEYVRLPDEVVFEGLAADLQLRDQVMVLDLAGEGKYGESPLSLEAHLGAPENLRDPGARYPVEVRLASEVTKAAVSGSVADPRTFRDLNIDVRLEGPNLGRLGEILQIGLPDTPPYRLSGNLTHEGARWRLGSLDGRIADSDIRGQAEIDLEGERPRIAAELRSDRLDFDDLGVLVGEPPQVGPGEAASEAQRRAAAQDAASERVLPDKKFDLPDLRAVDANLRYVATSVQARKLPLERVDLGLGLDGGVLRIDPIRFKASQGSVRAAMKLDGRDSPMASQIDLDIRQINLNVLLRQMDIDLPELDVEQDGRGALSGQARLRTRGNSVAAMAGALDGRLLVVADGGRINALLVEAAGLDVGEIAALLLTGEEDTETMVPIRCMVAEIPVAHGIARLDPFLLDTTDSNVVGTGTVDLGAETLDLRLAAFPKDVSLLSANVPVRVTGSFSEVGVELLEEEILEEGFIDLGLAEDARCRAMLESAGRKLEAMDEAPAAAR
jgi:AsmA family protein